MLSGNHEQWGRFDELFDAYWRAYGFRTAVPDRSAGESNTRRNRRPEVWDRVLPAEANADGAAPPHGAPPGDEGDDAAPEGTGRLVASDHQSLRKTDLRDLVSPEALAEAERVAELLARAMRYRLSRRRKAAFRGEMLDLRRTIRRNTAKGGDPIDLVWRRRPDRPIRLVVLLDVSGSMELYSRYFLLFVRGLLCRWLKADAFLFHTRLVRVTQVLREQEPLKAMGRLSLMMQGFGGGTQIAGSLRAFNTRYAKEAIDSRTVVVVMSDGYDCDPPAALARELAQLKRHARRLVWLNPLLGWRGYEPVARGMAAALPYIDHFAAANTLDALAALEDDLARL
jgi:uncharacterized protein with von Willebrand factor type A (vWA) domain